MNTVQIDNDYINIKIPKNYIENKYIQKLFNMLEIEEKLEKSTFTNEEAWNLSEEVKEKWWNENKDSFLKGIK